MYQTLETQSNEVLLGEIGMARAREMLSHMWLIRCFEEKAEELFSLGRVHGTMHLSIGQEALGSGRLAAPCSRATTCSTTIAATGTAWPGSAAM